MQLNPNNSVLAYKIDTGEKVVRFPYDPSTQYPEYAFHSISGNSNFIYDAIRGIFCRSGLDVDRFGSAQWNPLGTFIREGDTVLIKPNLVVDRRNKEIGEYFSVVTHPAIIRCIVDYVYIALKGKGKIIIGDAPINSANFKLICDDLGLTSLVERYALRNIMIELIDFRLYAMEKDHQGIIRNKAYSHSTSDYVEMKLDERSSLADIERQSTRFRVTEYDGKTMPLHHCAGRHRYLFHKSVVTADVIISIPKIKTHRKAGFTCAMKNYIGLNGYKDWLPHHTQGSIEEGGDEYLYKSFRKKMISKSWDARWKLSSPFLQSILLLLEKSILSTAVIFPFKDNYFEGSWYGNKTISRTINDLNRAVMYCDRNGELQSTRQRTLLYLVDGIICGEREGPMEATPKRCNIMLWGYNAFAVDMTVAQIIGFDPNKIDTLRVCRDMQTYKIFSDDNSQIKIMNNIDSKEYTLSTIRNLIRFSFKPSSGWKGHVELDDNI